MLCPPAQGEPGQTPEEAGALIPIKDDIASRIKPVVLLALIGANAAVWLYEVNLSGWDLMQMYYTWGLIPGLLTDPVTSSHLTAWEKVRPFLTSMFMHGSWMHIIGNMWFLWIFGDNVEDYLGHGRFLAFYLVTGLAAAGVHLLTNAGAFVPTVGASGAISGVLGGYLVLYPTARVLAYIPLGFFLYPVVLPAPLFLGFWFLLQFFSGTVSLLAGASSGGGVAWWAHVGGFVAGMLLVHVFGIGCTKCQREDRSSWARPRYVVRPRGRSGWGGW